jgi:hypothetical protein
MELTYTGKPVRVSLKEYDYATNWIMSRLVSKKLMKNISVELSLRKIKGLNGQTEVADDRKYPREFVVVVNPYLSRKSQLSTLAHELVHVKQFATGELKSELRGTLQKWKDSYVDHSETEYFDLPWEVEAWGREHGLYVRYLRHLHEENISF